MTCRVEDGVTYIQTYNTENRVSSIAKLESGTCASPGNYASKWDFTYDGDGTRAATLTTPYISGVPQTAVLTAYYFGGAYEVTGSDVKKYYSFQGQSILRDSTGLQYFLSDHLGSVVAITDDAGTLISEQRYLPFGEVRTVPNSMLSITDLGYTGQRDLGDMGLMDYKARFYSSYLNRFIQPDSIIPNPSNPQAWNRFTYVSNNPLRFVDPSGHTPCEGENWDDGPQCEKKKPGIYSGCSAKYGVFNGRFTCNAEDLNAATIKNRQDWFNGMLGSARTDLPEEFTNINGVLNAFNKTGAGKPGSAISWGDAGILVSIQNGLARHGGKPYHSGDPKADSAWATYFASFFSNRSDVEQTKNWGAAELLGTSYGENLVYRNNLSLSLAEKTFYFIGDVYRTGLLNHEDYTDLYGMDPSIDLALAANEWFYDTSSTVPGTNEAPVYYVTFFLMSVNSND